MGGATSMFDLVIVGAGPAATGCLLGLEGGLGETRTAIITGEAPLALPQNSPHPNLHSKVKQRMFDSSLGDVIRNVVPLQFRGRDYCLFESARAGGLSSFWGQQFVRLTAADFAGIGSSISDFAKYETACDLIEQGLRLQQSGLAIQDKLSGWDVTIRSARLVTPIDAFAQLFYSVSKAACVRHQRVDRIERTGEAMYKLVCEDGSEIIAKKVLLAAGLVATARILAKSFTRVRYIRFSDHAPFLFHTMAWSHQLLRRFGDRAQNMNALTIELALENRSSAYLSVYDLREVPANLALAQLGLPMARILRGRRASALQLPYFPIQAWTSGSVGEIELTYEHSQDRLVVTRCEVQKDEDGLELTRKALRLCGFTTLNHSVTPPGLGFHHHALRLSEDGAHYEDATTYVTREFGAGIAIVDGSAMPRLTPRPHTETLVANAFWLARSMQGTADARDALTPGEANGHPARALVAQKRVG